MENEIVEQYQKGNETLKIFEDLDPPHPREGDNLGTIAYKHRNISLGEEEIQEPIEWLEDKLGIENKEEYSNERLKELEEKFFKEYIALKVFIYEHSGISFSTSAFSCPWDSGQYGYIYTTKEKAKEEGLTEEKAREVLESEIKDIDTLETEGAYCFRLEKEIPVKVTREYEDGSKETEETTETKEEDSCCGFRGFDGIKQILEETNFQNATRIK